MSTGALTRLDWESWKRDLVDLVMDCAIANATFRRLSQMSGKEEEHLSQYAFLDRIRYMNYRTLIEDLDKLFADTSSSNQRRSFTKLFKRVVDSGVEASFFTSQPFPTSSIHIWKDQLEVKKAVLALQSRLNPHLLAIQAIKADRDQIFAHTDPAFKPIVSTPDQVDQLARLAVEIFRELCLGFEGVDVSMDIAGTARPELMVDFLVSAIQVRDAGGVAELLRRAGIPQ